VSSPLLLWGSYCDHCANATAMNRIGHQQCSARTAAKHPSRRSAKKVVQRLHVLGAAHDVNIATIRSHDGAEGCRMKDPEIQRKPETTPAKRRLLPKYASRPAPGAAFSHGQPGKAPNQWVGPNLPSNRTARPFRAFPKAWTPGLLPEEPELQWQIAPWLPLGCTPRPGKAGTHAPLVL